VIERFSSQRRLKEADKMDLHDYHPQPALVTHQTAVSKPRFPVIDAHNHLAPGFGGGWDQRPLGELLDVLDQSGVTQFVDLDGMWNEQTLHAHLKRFKEAVPDRFLIFTGVDWSAWPEQGDRFGEWAARRLRAHVRRGAQGLKVWKDLGLEVKDQHGQLVRVSDERLDPLWQTAAELNIPVTTHISVPVAFFDRLDNTNERWEELHDHPEWHFPSPPNPPFLQVVNDMADMIARNPRTTFIGAHVGCYAEDLDWVAQVLEHCPNFNVDISERIGELGRQPYSARRFFMKYSDRILFGLDRPAAPAEYQIYYRFLETGDEYFAYGTEDPPRQGRWRIYGLYLPDDVLEQVYSRNARRLILHES
jgi:predicted TIM-barrel fold metal-dependent hydrolase